MQLKLKLMYIFTSLVLEFLNMRIQKYRANLYMIRYSVYLFCVFVYIENI